MDLLKEHGQVPEVINYLEQPPSKEELEAIIQKLGVDAVDIVRKGEAIYLEKYQEKNLSEKEWIQAMVTHPILIERPIIVKGDKAVIGRPPENVLKLL